MNKCESGAGSKECALLGGIVDFYDTSGFCFEDELHLHVNGAHLKPGILQKYNLTKNVYNLKIYPLDLEVIVLTRSNDYLKTITWDMDFWVDEYKDSPPSKTTKFNWDMIREDVIAIAMDNGGWIYGYTQIPVYSHDGQGWGPKRGNTIKYYSLNMEIFKFHSTVLQYFNMVDVNPEDSLRLRPGTVLNTDSTTASLYGAL